MKQQLIDLIEANKAKIEDLRAHGTERMSKTGVKWCIWSLREQNKRLRADLKEQ